MEAHPDRWQHPGVGIQLPDVPDLCDDELHVADTAPVVAQVSSCWRVGLRDACLPVCPML